MTIFCACFIGVGEFGVVHACTLVSVRLLEDLVRSLLREMYDIVDCLSLGNVLQEFLTDCTLAAKLAALGSKLLLGLGCESWIDDEAVDEEKHVVLDLCIFQGNTTLVLLLNDLCKLVDDLIGDVVDMCASRGCCD